ncbi:hypothetical protein BG011_004475 [Mortierella polycephala]|uniref:Uncharacterized protein n=1 Tax=Mortierella polycephala TaxID=41804 RepID=A0A9P6PY32_9FUNG|nr:hypothetical protein BG011_004475 [Mortierella polycephala]
MDKDSMDVCNDASVTPKVKLVLKRNIENLGNDKVSASSTEYELSDDTDVGYLGTTSTAQYEPTSDASKPLPLKKASMSTNPVVSVVTPISTCSIGDAKAGERIYKKFRESLKKGDHIPRPMSASVSPQKKPLTKSTEAKRLTLKASQELKHKTRQMLKKSWRREFSGLKPKWKPKEEVPVEVVSPITGSMTPPDDTCNIFNQEGSDESHLVNHIQSPQQMLSSPSISFLPSFPSLKASRLSSPQSPCAIVSPVTDVPLTLRLPVTGIFPAHDAPPVPALYDSNEQDGVLSPMACDFSPKSQERGRPPCQHSTGMQAQQPVVHTAGNLHVSGPPIQNLRQRLESLEQQLEADMRSAPRHTPMKDGHGRNRNGGQGRGHGCDNMLGLGPDPDRGFSWGSSKGGYSSDCRRGGVQGDNTGPPLHLHRQVADYSELYTVPSCQSVESYTESPSATGSLGRSSNNISREGYIGQDQDHGQNGHLHRTPGAYYGSDYRWSSADEGSYHLSHGHRQGAGFKEQGPFGPRNGAGVVIDPGTPNNCDSEESRCGLRGQGQGHEHNLVPNLAPQGDPALWSKPLPWRQEHVQPSANPFSDGEDGAAIYTANCSASSPDYPDRVFDQIGQQYD